jgi:hypothetical protein
VANRPTRTLGQSDRMRLHPIQAVRAGWEVLLGRPAGEVIVTGPGQLESFTLRGSVAMTTDLDFSAEEIELLGPATIKGDVQCSNVVRR